MQNIPVRLPRPFVNRAANEFPFNFGDSNDGHSQAVRFTHVAAIEQPADLGAVALFSQSTAQDV